MFVHVNTTFVCFPRFRPRFLSRDVFRAKSSAPAAKKATAFVRKVCEVYVETRLVEVNKFVRFLISCLHCNVSVIHSVSIV